MNTLAEPLSSRVKAEVFRLLFGAADGELHVREVEHKSGLADATVRQELKRLTRLGVVEPRRDGNRSYYHANSAHLRLTNSSGVRASRGCLLIGGEDDLKGMHR